MGGSKPLAQFGGAPLIERPLAAAREAGLDAVVVAKADTPLPDGLPCVARARRAVPPTARGSSPRSSARTAPWSLSPATMPFVPAELLARLAHGGAVRAGGRIEPFPARYEPAWLPELRAALERGAPVRATLEALGPATIEWDAAALRSINTPEDLNE